MGASLKYAKVVDRELFLRSGGTITPGLDNKVQLLAPAPAKTGVFEVHRSWFNVDGAFTESWRIVDPHGRTVHQGLDREVVGGNQDLVDEVADLELDYADDAYQLVLEIDGREVARVGFEVADGAAEPDGEAP